MIDTDDIDQILADPKATTDELRECIATLRAELTVAERDAARYRKMRNNAQFQYRNGPGLYWYLPRYYGPSLTAGERLDNSVDAEP